MNVPLGYMLGKYKHLRMFCIIKEKSHLSEDLDLRVLLLYFQDSRSGRIFRVIDIAMSLYHDDVNNDGNDNYIV